MASKPMFPDKASMIRAANILWVILTVAPALYLVIGALVTLGTGGFESKPTFTLFLSLALVFVSASNMVLTVFVQTRKKFTQVETSPDPVGRTFLTMWLGAILSEAHAIYGLILTLLSGSILYGVGFSLVTWASLIWVRGRFKQNLGKLPDNPAYSTGP